MYNHYKSYEIISYVYNEALIAPAPRYTAATGLSRSSSFCVTPHSREKAVRCAKSPRTCGTHFVVAGFLSYTARLVSPAVVVGGSHDRLEARANVENHPQALASLRLRVAADFPRHEVRQPDEEEHIHLYNEISDIPSRNFIGDF